MNAEFQPSLDFTASETASEAGEALILDLDGYEGPLHLLLALARGQKVDLLQISVARLAEQYLAFVEAQRHQRFGLAAEYLVMAAWLAYLKSRLLLPKPQRAGGDEPLAEELAEALAFRLAKLDAMRKAADALAHGPQLRMDVFPRGDPDAQVSGQGRLEGDLYELIAAYATQRLRETTRRYMPAARVGAYPLEAARDRLKGLAPTLTDWTRLDAVAPRARSPDGPSRASYVASTFSAGLEMVRDGVLELRQLDAFAALYLRTRGQGVDALERAA